MTTIDEDGMRRVLAIINERVAAEELDVSDFPGIDGFLGTRASWAMDAMALVMALVVVLLATSVYQVRTNRRFKLHRRVQLPLTLGLFATVVLFELDVRFNGWEERAAGTVGGTASTAAWAALAVHLLFAVPSVVLWLIVIIRASRNFGTNPRPNGHSTWHRRWAPIAAIGMIMTAVTSWIFYGIAYVA